MHRFRATFGRSRLFRSGEKVCTQYTQYIRIYFVPHHKLRRAGNIYLCENIYFKIYLSHKNFVREKSRGNFFLLINEEYILLCIYIIPVGVIRPLGSRDVQASCLHLRLPHFWHLFWCAAVEWEKHLLVKEPPNCCDRYVRHYTKKSVISDQTFVLEDVTSFLLLLNGNAHTRFKKCR